MFEKTLCAIDGSKSAERAVQFAVAFAKKFGAELQFVTVSLVSQQTAARSPYWDARLFDAGETQIAHELALALSAADVAGVSKVSCATLSGNDVASAIVNYAAENGFDHIVMGSAGHSAFGRLLTGSVVDNVLQKKHPPVTVV